MTTARLIGGPVYVNAPDRWIALGRHGMVNEIFHLAAIAADGSGRPPGDGPSGSTS
jgi:hypothetical protein